MPKVRYERRGAAAVLTIDRPERRNAVDAETADLLLDGFRSFEGDDEARVLVLTGAGPEAFCAGADLKAIAESGSRTTPEDAIQAVSERPEGPMGFTRLAASKPTIAAISGWCLAGGLELALWCDLRIAAEGSTLGFPERRWGVPLVDGGTQRLPRVIGLGNEVVPAGGHVERALEIAEALARFPQQTMLADRLAAIEGIGMTFEEGLTHEARSGRETAETAARGAAR